MSLPPPQAEGALPYFKRPFGRQFLFQKWKKTYQWSQLGKIDPKRLSECGVNLKVIWEMWQIIYTISTAIYQFKHCQRHNGPEGWVLFIEVTSLGLEQKLNYMTKLHLPNLHQTVVNTILVINMSNSNNLNKFELSSSHARVTSIKFTKQSGS